MDEPPRPPEPPIGERLYRDWVEQDARVQPGPSGRLPIDRMPGTVAWAIGLTWFHAALGLVFFFVALGQDAAGAALYALFGGLLSVVLALGLTRRRPWAWGLTVALSAIGILVGLAQMRISLSTNVAVLILLLTPSARAWFGI
jgi:hypothetical protein